MFERHWQRMTAVSVLLYPLSLVFRIVVALRRSAFRASLLRAHRLRVPVIVVGNITVGGTGKTPLVIWIASFLTREGFRPGIVSRGYGSQSNTARRVARDSDASSVGDEPLLLARRTDCPVWIGADRVAAAEALLRSHPDCDVIVSDDGLQHYALARDFEIAVIDGARGLGNRLMLPAGPLREPPSRLRSVDAVVVNGSGDPGTPASPALAMKLEGREFHNLLNPGHTVDASHFQDRRIHAVAAIGNPQRFFDHLAALGLHFQAHAFPDHHAYTAQEIAFTHADAILMTEKDAVKCAGFAAETHWFLRVDAVPHPNLSALLLQKLKLSNPLR
jgi:tetraacyldisaccharide 4'-kinase